MNEHATLSAIDYAVFFAYMALTMLLGFAVSRNARRRPRDYFLGEKKLRSGPLVFAVDARKS